MESAIVFMTVILALSFLLTTLILMGHLNLTRNSEAETQRLELDQIGAYYLASLAEKFDFDNDDYRAGLTEKGYSITEKTVTQLTVRRGGTVVLSITVDGDKKPTSWRYSAPES